MGSQLAGEAAKLAKQVRINEPGCLMYIPHVSAQHPEVILFFEKYIDQDAFAAHGQTQYYKDFKKACQDLVAQDTEIQFYEELTV